MRACYWQAVCYMTASKRYGTTSTTAAHPTAVQLLVDLVVLPVLYRYSRARTVGLVDASGIFDFLLSGVSVVVPFSPY